MCHDLLNYTNVIIDDICEATKFSEDFVENVLDALTQKNQKFIWIILKELKCVSVNIRI